MTRSLFHLIVFFAATALAGAQNLPPKSDILANLQKVNQYYMSTNPETESVTSVKTTWLIGAYFNGHMAMFDLYPTKESIRYALQWGKNNDWNLGDTRQEADNQCVGQAFMDIYYAYGAKDAFMLSKVGASVRNLVNKSAHNDWNWIDALYMAMPVLTRYGVWNNDTRYFDKLYNMYHSTKASQGLYDASFGLWYRDAKFDPPYKTPGGKRCYWSRGNGWVFGAHVRTIKYLPENDSHRHEYIETYKKMAAALKGVQRSDGFWNVSLGDTTDYPGPETSGTAFFVYGIAWGINNGFLDKETYMPTVIKGWNGLVSKALDSNGRVGYVQGVGLEPKSSQPVLFSSSRDYGEGNFLLAGSEVIKLAEGELPVPTDFFVKGVEVLDVSTLKVDFFEPAEKNSAEDVSNYFINNGVKVEGAILAQDGMSVDLKLSNIFNGAHGISFGNIKSVSDKNIADGSGKYFMYTQGESLSIENQTKSSSQLRLYPNPVNQDYINLDFTATKTGMVRVQLFDTAGKLLRSENYTLESRGGHPKFPLHGILKGMYILNVEGAGYNLRNKIVVN